MSKKQKGRTHTQEAKFKMRIAKLGKKHTDEFKAARRAYKHTEEAKINISKNHAFKFGRPGHGERMSGENNPGIIYRGKSWKINPETGKRIWI